MNENDYDRMNREDRVLLLCCDRRDDLVSHRFQQAITILLCPSGDGSASAGARLRHGQ
jgi:hypothetical protein